MRRKKQQDPLAEMRAKSINRKVYLVTWRGWAVGYYPQGERGDKWTPRKLATRDATHALSEDGFNEATAHELEFARCRALEDGSFFGMQPHGLGHLWCPLHEASDSARISWDPKIGDSTQKQYKILDDRRLRTIDPDGTEWYYSEPQGEPK